MFLRWRRRRRKLQNSKWHRSVTLIEIECCRSVVFRGCCSIYTRYSSRFIIASVGNCEWQVLGLKWSSFRKHRSINFQPNTHTLPFTQERGVYRDWSESKWKRAGLKWGKPTQMCEIKQLSCSCFRLIWNDIIKSLWVMEPLITLLIYFLHKSYT